MIALGHLIIYGRLVVLAGKHHVPVADIALRQAHRLWVGTENHTGTADASAVRHARVHPS